ncbi:MAG: peptidase MA family metallohydrolase [Anaerolineales bacterium]|jgi:hypothetical protein|nr:peptidase MA family metallohydrolase [Anaerolineales bacterium]
MKKRFFFANLNRVLPFLVTLVLLILTPAGVRAQQVEVIETQVTYAFGGQVTFWARVSLPAEPEEALVFYRSKGDSRTMSGILSVNGDEVSFVHDLTQAPMRAFAEIEYWFGFRFPEQDDFVSSTYSFLYDDNRFQWRQIQSDPILINWYEGDLAFGQMALDTAQASLEKARTWFDFPAPEPLRFYLYASAPEMQSTLRLGSMSMVGGHTSPDLRVMIVSLPNGPDQKMETERQIPHEIIHVLLYEKLGEGSLELPTWLTEGLASKNEFYPNPDYHVILADAVEREMLLPMSSLCNGFPLDAASYFLAYSQAESFVGFLYDQFGKSGIESLLEQYANGVNCERGAELALGVPLAELDEQWQKEQLGISSNTLIPLDHPLLPWLVLAILILAVPVLAVVSSLVHGNRAKTNPQEDIALE